VTRGNATPDAEATRAAEAKATPTEGAAHPPAQASQVSPKPKAEPQSPRAEQAPQNASIATAPTSAQPSVVEGTPSPVLQRLLAANAERATPSSVPAAAPAGGAESAPLAPAVPLAPTAGASADLARDAASSVADVPAVPGHDDAGEAPASIVADMPEALGPERMGPIDEAPLVSLRRPGVSREALVGSGWSLEQTVGGGIALATGLAVAALVAVRRFS
jgi:hypothetical protein